MYSFFVVVLTDIGVIFSWGSNGEGQLGTGNYEETDSPIRILQLSSTPVQIAAGSSHSFLLTGMLNVVAHSNGIYIMLYATHSNAIGICI